MKCQCNTEQRRLTPGVFNLKQYLNGTETMVWTLTNRTTNGGECDLCDFDAFLVLSASGKIDEVQLEKRMTEEGTMELTWDVGNYATGLTGYVKYQIVFKSAATESLGVTGATNSSANGIYNLTITGAEGYARVFRNSATGYQIKWDNEAARWTLYESDGQTVVDYQIFPNPQPCCGGWKAVFVSNNTAAVWASDEAIMFVSETVAADETVTANFPTILRQMQARMQNMIIKSGVTAVEKTVVENAWTGDAAPYCIDVMDVFGDEIPAGCTVIAANLYQIQEDGSVSDIANINTVAEKDGKIKIYSSEKVAGKLIISVTGGNGYFIADIGTDFSGIAAQAAASAQRAANSAAFADEAITAANGAANAANSAATAANNAANATEAAATAATEAAEAANTVAANAEASATAAADSATAAAASATDAARYADRAEAATGLDAVSEGHFGTIKGATDAEVAAGELNEYRAITPAQLKAQLDTKVDGEHYHSISEIYGLSGKLDGKASVTHYHDIEAIQGLPEAIQSKAEADHTHTADDFPGLVETLNAKADEIHYHAISNVDGLEAELDRKFSAEHQPEITDVVGLEVALDGKVNRAEMEGKTDVGHGHKIEDVNGLQDTLDTKATNADLTYLREDVVSLNEAVGKLDGFTEQNTFVDPETKTVQIYHKEIAGIMTKEDASIQDDVITINGNTVTVATETKAGLVQQATNAELEEGTGSYPRAISPAQLAAAISAAGGGGGHTKWGTWEDRTPGTLYTADADGWIRIKVEAWDGDEVQLVVDGVEVFGTRMDWSSEYNYITGLVPVFAGQTYRASASQVSELQFAPCV